MTAEKEGGLQNTTNLWIRAIEAYPELEKYGSGEQLIVEGRLLKFIINNPRALLLPAYFKDIDSEEPIELTKLSSVQMDVLWKMTDLCNTMEWELRRKVR